MKVLVIGGGGREHSIVWKLRQSKLVNGIFVAPGNFGISKIACCVRLDVTDVEGLKQFAEKEKIDLTIVGSEESLTLDIVDIFSNKGLKIVGPCGHDAQVETSKVFGKFLMKESDIPTASFKVFSSYSEALGHIVKRGFPLVIKADGLARGKGVRVCSNDLDATSFLRDLMVNKMYGEAGKVVIIEDCLKGIEYSAHALVSGNTIIPFPMSQDYKTFEGRNTGGMGAIAPVLTESKDFLDELTKTVTRPVIDHLASLKGHSPIYDPFGFIYPGIMVTTDGLHVLEFNVRMGDPEAQVYMRLLKSDLAEVLLACAENRLSEIELEWHDGYAVCVVLVSEKYPSGVSVGDTITGIEEAEKLEGVKVFHAGTGHIMHRLVTNGGRILNVTAVGKTLEDARVRAYKAVEEIHFEGMQYRKDIGLV